jgi:hypothetical protein
MSDLDFYVDAAGRAQQRKKKTGRPSKEDRLHRSVLLTAMRKARLLELQKEMEPELITKLRELLIFTRNIRIPDTKLAVIAGVRVDVIAAIRSGMYRGTRKLAKPERIMAAIQELLAAIFLQAQELELLDDRALRPVATRMRLREAEVTFETYAVAPKELKQRFIGDLKTSVEKLITVKTQEIATALERKGYDDVEVRVFIEKEKTISTKGEKGVNL